MKKVIIPCLVALAISDLCVATAATPTPNYYPTYHLQQIIVTNTMKQEDDVGTINQNTGFPTDYCSVKTTNDAAILYIQFLYQPIVSTLLSTVKRFVDDPTLFNGGSHYMAAVPLEFDHSAINPWDPVKVPQYQTRQGDSIYYNKSENNNGIAALNNDTSYPGDKNTTKADQPGKDPSHWRIIGFRFHIGLFNNQYGFPGLIQSTAKQTNQLSSNTISPSFPEFESNLIGLGSSTNPSLPNSVFTPKLYIKRINAGLRGTSTIAPVIRLLNSNNSKDAAPCSGTSSTFTCSSAQTVMSQTTTPSPWLPSTTNPAYSAGFWSLPIYFYGPDNQDGSHKFLYETKNLLGNYVINFSDAAQTIVTDDTTKPPTTINTIAPVCGSDGLPDNTKLSSMVLTIIPTGFYKNG